MTARGSDRKNHAVAVRRLSLAVAVAAVAALALVAAGCGSDSGTSATTQWADDLCTAVDTWRDDISEDNSLAAYDEARSHRLAAMLHDWLERVEARIPEPNPDWPGPPDG